MLQEKRICPYCNKPLPEYFHKNRKYHVECALLKQKNASRLYQQKKLVTDLPTTPKPKMKNGMMLVPGMTREEQVRRWDAVIKGHERFEMEMREFNVRRSPTPTVSPIGEIFNSGTRKPRTKKVEIPPHTHRTKYSTARTEDGRDVVIEHRF